WQTGVYKSDCLIVAPEVACGPCPHSSPCSQKSHLCAEELAPAVVASAMHHYISGDWTSLHRLGDELADSVSLYRTAFLPSGFWFPEKLGAKFVTSNISTSGELCAWRAVLDKSHLQGLGESGSEGLALARFWLKRLGTSAREKLRLITNEIESE